ncbi:HAMP domain-containing sensor histidine kinase [Terrisporobacter petrolearius]|uniref:HAMP domain-containing sensor histidine kinase n=1 Tax=Terrisporobacter petrolearius TaxID=1460447 RepID=UPI0031CC77A1
MKRNNISQSKGKSLYSIFIINSIIAVFIFILGIVIFSKLLVKIPEVVNDKNLGINNNKLDYLFKENYKDLDINKIISEGGWIEEIENGEVINVKGTKKDEKYKYLIEDFINNNNTNEKYETRAYKENNKLYIVKIPDYNHKLANELNNKKLKIYMTLSLILTIIIVSVMLLLVTIISIKKLSKPLKILENEINKMSEGYSNVSVKYNSYKELNRIKEAFNTTVSKLEKSEEEKKTAQDSKKRIIRDISHDLKTPITSVLGYSKAMLDDIVTDENDKKTYLTYIYNKTKRINYLVDELFIFSKFDSPGYKLNLEKYDVCEFLRELIAFYYIDIEDKNFLLDVDLPNETIYSMIDTKQLERALGNLITNSIKYNKMGTKISISLIKEVEDICIVIEDNGIGISEDIIDKVFDEFVRADECRKTDGGSGLGLAITKKIIKLHNGHIKLYSKINFGTKFVIRLKRI